MNKSTVSRSFAGRTLAGLRDRWRDRGTRLPGVDTPLAVSENLARVEELTLVRTLMQECLAAKGGEVSARARARRLSSTWFRLNAAGRLRFLQTLAEDFGVDSGEVRRLAEELVQAPTGDSRSIERRIRVALSADRRGLIRQLAAVPGGMKLVVDMRAELLTQTTTLPAKNEPELAELDNDMFDLLADWFDIGFLELRRISWDSPASVLEKVIAYEAVHRIDSWADLRNRLDSDRRCYAFFHPRMPEEPLIFVEVALAAGIAASVQELLDLDAPLADAADTAVFYSISNTQAGLRGVGFGDFLIKRVVDDLQRELPSLRQFVTLSPIPGLRRWFQGATDQEVSQICGSSIGDVAAVRTKLDAAPAGEEHGQYADDLQGEVLKLAAGYLLRAKRGASPSDPVARFHLGNGARVERLNWNGDTSTKGLTESFGVMVNYRYELAHIEANHEAYAADSVVVTSKEIRELIEPPKRRTDKA